jgi:hypothetical protein
MRKKISRVNYSLVDTEGRRQKIDRRQFSYIAHIPERRSGKDRRSDEDFQSTKAQRRFEDIKTNLNHEDAGLKREQSDFVD